MGPSCLVLEFHVPYQRPEIDVLASTHDFPPSPPSPETAGGGATARCARTRESPFACRRRSSRTEPGMCRGTHRLGGLVEIGPQTSEVLYCYKLRKDFDCQIGDASFDRRR